jgi:hemerythrin
MAQKNKEDHRRFVDVLSGYRQRYAVNGFDRAEACTLMDTIDRWLAEHICGVDMHLKHCAKTA